MEALLSKKRWNLSAGDGSKYSSWTHQVFWREMEPKKKTTSNFQDPILGEVWRCHPPGTLYLSIYFYAEVASVFCCNSKCTHAKMKFGCLNIIRAQCVHHLQQTVLVPFSMLIATPRFFPGETNVSPHRVAHLNCPLPIFAHGFRSPGSNRIGDDDA